MTQLQTMANRAAVAAHIGALDLVESMQDRVERASSADGVGAYVRFHGWIILIGIFVVAAAAGFVYCRAEGYDGFTGNVKAHKGPLGIQIGVELECT